MGSAALPLKLLAFIRVSEPSCYFKGAFITVCELASGGYQLLPGVEGALPGALRWCRHCSTARRFSGQWPLGTWNIRAE